MPTATFLETPRMETPARAAVAKLGQRRQIQGLISQEFPGSNPGRRTPWGRMSWRLGFLHYLQEPVGFTDVQIPFVQDVGELLPADNLNPSVPPLRELDRPVRPLHPAGLEARLPGLLPR